MTRNTGWKIPVALALGALALPSGAQVISSSPDLPPAGGAYVSPSSAHTIYSFLGTTFDIFNIRQFGFSASTPPPVNVGASTLDSYTSLLTGMLSINGGPATPFSALALSSFGITKVAGVNGQPTGLFQTEMLQMDLIGLPGGALVRESPTLLSPGATAITDIGGGSFQINSFFDVFTELSLDGGASWIPATGPTHLDLTAAPEPGSVALAALGLLATPLLRRRRSR